MNDWHTIRWGFYFCDMHLHWARMYIADNMMSDARSMLMEAKNHCELGTAGVASIAALSALENFSTSLEILTCALDSKQNIMALDSTQSLISIDLNPSSMPVHSRPSLVRLEEGWSSFTKLQKTMAEILRAVSSDNIHTFELGVGHDINLRLKLLMGVCIGLLLAVGVEFPPVPINQYLTI